jgi:O-glycosyl hydrolase
MFIDNFITLSINVMTMLQSFNSSIAYTDLGPSDSMIAYNANVASYNLYLTNTGKERVLNRSTAKFRKSINQGDQHSNLSLPLHSTTSFTLFLYSRHLSHFSERVR